METALAWAVSAKNALQNRGGYSPNQLVFGTNVNLPSVITDLASALESFTLQSFKSLILLDEI